MKVQDLLKYVEYIIISEETLKEAFNLSSDENDDMSITCARIVFKLLTCIHPLLATNHSVTNSPDFETKMILEITTRYTNFIHSPLWFDQGIFCEFQE